MRQPIILILLLAGIILSAAAQENIDKRIADIRFEGLSSVSENELYGLMRQYIGQIYSDKLSWDIQSKLYALDYFDLITPRIDDGASGTNTVILVFDVQEKPLVSKINFVGNAKVRRGQLLDVVLIKSGDLFNAGALSFDEQVVTELYLEKGFIDAKVSSSFELEENDNTVIITFDIEENTQTKISEIRFVGNDKYVSDNKLRNLISTKAQSLFNKGLFVETTLQEDLKAIEQYYGDQGLVDVSILDLNKEIVSDEEDKINRMLITIVIQEGEPWEYGGMSFQGNTIYRTEELEALLNQESGSTFNLSAFQRDYQKILDLYFENGYIFNSFTYTEERDEEKRILSYNVDIVERDRAHIENIIIRGNSKTKSYLIRRELPIEEGEVFSKARIAEGTLNLLNLRYFDAVEPTPYPGSQDGLMDLVIDVSEGKTTELSFGLSFSGGGDFPLSAQLNWKDRNFIGRGQIIGASLKVSPDVQQVQLSFTEPRLMGLRWSGGLYLSYAHQLRRRINQDHDLNGVPDPYDTWEEYNNAGKSVPGDSQMQYDSHSISLGLNTGYTWQTSVGRLGVSTGLNFIWSYLLYDSKISTPHNRLLRENLDTWKYSDSIFLKLSWDTRDLIFDANKGFLLSQTFTYAGILEAVSNRNYIKSVSRFNWNLLLFDVPVGKKEGRFKSVFSIESAFSAIFDKPWRTPDGDIAETNGFAIDGMFIGRGWPVTTGEYYRFLWDNTAMIKFPIVPNILSFDIFLDAIGAWLTESGEDSALNKWVSDDWRFSLGAGLRFANPQFPIGLYLVKRFQWKDNQFTWFPDDPSSTWYEFPSAGLDLVIAFDLDIY